MIHKATLTVTILLFVVTCSITVVGYKQRTTLHHSWDGNLGREFGYCDWHFEYVSRVPTGGMGYHPDWPGSWCWQQISFSGSGIWETEIRFPVWALLLLLASYPTIAFIRGPLRRHRRRKRNECIHCGYNLTGNVSGICPECGEEI